MVRVRMLQCVFSAIGDFPKFWRVMGTWRRARRGSGSVRSHLAKRKSASVVGEVHGPGPAAACKALHKGEFVCSSSSRIRKARFPPSNTRRPSCPTMAHPRWLFIGSGKRRVSLIPLSMAGVRKVNLMLAAPRRTELIERWGFVQQSSHFLSPRRRYNLLAVRPYRKHDKRTIE